ncbi:hypothetical protein PO883_21345 [Massilia sp. DJPM01]|uniref:hypothetical protein n=1 Tax=Massilia sp. DJPM01 TaxID=3024404 RepID=UPI00259FDE38|nr:hypothetical protein [Massilia sp. DJPM01]MDM5179741.1 hypothetical protein [Massilia sp. DJPM01]
MSSVLDQFFMLSDAVFMAVREGGVPSNDAIESLLSALDELAKEYGSQNSLPKDLVGVMLDMSTALYSAAAAQAEPVRTTLYEQFDVITDKMRDLCS